MSIATHPLPVSEVVEPEDTASAAEVIRTCRESGTPIYPIGGATSLHFGLPPVRQGIGLSLAKMNNVVDYPARDLTITLQAGVTLKTVADTLAAERQRLPFDVPDADRATLGGVVATNFNGPLQYSQGTVRDHVIGIQAIDGTGMVFSGGGRVVKNVAGYDFCKLLTGSLGTLGLITQLTLKLKPQPSESALVVCQPKSLDDAECMLAKLVHSSTTPAAIELLGGPTWRADPSWQQLALPDEHGLILAVAFEGTAAEVPWMVEQLQREWREQGQEKILSISEAEADCLTDSWTEFPAIDSPLVVRFNVVPSHTTKVIAAAQKVDENCSFQAHAGNGIAIVRFSEFPSAGMAQTVVAQLQPAARLGSGSVVILANPSGAESTRQSTWGGSDTPFSLMDAVKKQFDPDNLLNPDRFVYS